MNVSLILVPTIIDLTTPFPNREHARNERSISCISMLAALPCVQVVNVTVRQGGVVQRVDEYLAALFIADTSFNDCFVEHHYPGNSWALPGTEINVGELGTPINGSAFIGDTEHAGAKLRKVLWPQFETPAPPPPPPGCDDICNPECPNFDAWACCPDPGATACCQRFSCIYP